jgi:hypothetical protein
LGHSGACILRDADDCCSRPLWPILSAIEQGDPHAAEELLPRKLAAQRLAQEQPGLGQYRITGFLIP